jgi:cellulose synthase/poly-beta-1,6-N-acetylglucosamine synthase-like glycosyltransferase
MGKVIYDLFFKGIVSWFVVVWCIITIIMAQRRFDGWRFERREKELAPIRNSVVFENGLKNDYRVTTLVTCAKEDPVVFLEAMKRLRQQQGLVEHRILVMIDAIDDPGHLTEDDARCLVIAKTYADKVYLTDARNKRWNLARLTKLAREEGLLRDALALMDSDTICDHDWVMAFLCHDLLQDPKMGGVTTAQRVLRTCTYPERIGDWLENARIKASMAAGSLYGEVGCLPGRLYAVRTKLVEARMPELASEVWTGWRLATKWPFVERWSAQCAAGDDRQITNFVLEAGYKTSIVLPAGVRTLVPDGWWKLYKTWRRWGTSSQGYVYRTMDWLWKRPYVLYHYASDIVISHVSVFLVLSWIYAILFGQEALALPLTAVVLLSVIGMMATFAVRQWPHLREHPGDLRILPLFVLVVTLAQFVRVLAHWTPWRIGWWGTRAGVDQTTHEPVCVCVK